MADYKINLRVSEILGDGNCPRGHVIGETFSYPEDLGKLCPSALHSIYPDIRVMQSGGSFPWFKDKNTHLRCCPDPKRPVVIEITRKKL